MHYEHDGMRLWIEPPGNLSSDGLSPGSDATLMVGVEPADASNRVQVQYRVNGGPTTAIPAEPIRHAGNAQYFRAQLPCAALGAGDTVEYTAVCKCAGRQVPSPPQTERFGSSFQIGDAATMSAQVPALSRATSLLVRRATDVHVSPASASVVAWGGQSPILLRPTHLCLFVLTRDKGHPIARMPFYAEVGVKRVLPPPKPECKLKHEIIRAGIWIFLDKFFSFDGPPPIETLIKGFCDALVGLLAPETIETLAQDPAASTIVADIFEKTYTLTGDTSGDFNPAALLKFLEKAVLAYAEEHKWRLADTNVQGEQIVWLYPLGVLATDHVGYLSFDLTRLPEDVAEAVGQALEARRRDPYKPTDAAIWVYPMARDEMRFDALAQGRFAQDAIVLKLELDAPELPEAIKNMGLLAMQKPDLTDWRLSPSSFAVSPSALLGEDGCENLFPANVALQEFHFYQVIGLSDVSSQLADLEGVRDKVKVGVVNEYRLAWYPLGHSLGQIQYSLPLAPGESVNLAVIDWTRRDVDTRSEDTKEAEQLVHNQRRDRTITETVNAAIKEYQSGSSFMAGLGASVGLSAATGAAVGGPVGLGVGLAAGLAGSLGGASSNSGGSRDIAASTVQKLSDNITQASASMRELQSTVVVQTTQSEKESIETRTVVNYNHSHALTILYYEVLRHFRTVTEYVRRRPIALVKLRTSLLSNGSLVTAPRWNDIHNSDPTIVGKALAQLNLYYQTIQTLVENRSALETAILDKRYSEGFNALERIAHRAQVANATPTLKPNQFDPGMIAFKFFKFEIKVGGWFPKLGEGSQYVKISAKLRGPGKEYNLVKFNNDWDELNPRGTFEVGDSFNTFWAKLNPSEFKDRPAEVLWGDIDEIHLGVTPNHSIVSIAYLKITGRDQFGDHVLVEQDYGGGHLGVFEAYDIILPINWSGPKVPPDDPLKVPTPEETEDEVKGNQLIDHLRYHSAHYSRALYLNQNVSDRAQQLDAIKLNGSTVLEKVENRPLELVGDFVAYPCADRKWADLIENAIKATPLPDVLPDERLITLPTRGVFAEAKLGHCNASEEIDNTRFWDWQQSPIPHFAPEIAPTQPVTPQPQQPNLAPTPFPQSLVNIVNPPAAPDPTGLAAALNVLGTPNIFRDMSGRAEVADLLKRLSDNSISIADAANRARDIQARHGIGFSSGGSRGGLIGTYGTSPAIGGPRARPTEPSSGTRDLLDMPKVLNKLKSAGLITPDTAGSIAEAATRNAYQPELPQIEQVGDRYVPPATTPNELIGLVGEALLGDSLEKNGIIVFRDWNASKHVSATGIDLVASDPQTGEVWLLDNKAQIGGIGKANALTGDKFDTYKEDVRTFLENVSADPEAAKAAQLLRQDKFKKVVANAWAGSNTGFTTGLFANRDLSVYDIRMGRLFTTYDEWIQAFKNLPTGIRRPGLRGVIILEAGLLALAVAEGTRWAVRSDKNAVINALGEFVAEATLGEVLSRLPGGLFAGFTLALETDNPQYLEARRREDTIEQISDSIPGFYVMSPAEQDKVKEMIREIYENPVEIQLPPEPPRRGIHLPGFDWPPQPTYT